jgi:hypothetical protein
LVAGFSFLTRKRSKHDEKPAGKEVMRMDTFHTKARYLYRATHRIRDVIEQVIGLVAIPTRELLLPTVHVRQRKMKKPAGAHSATDLREHVYRTPDMFKNMVHRHQIVRQGFRQRGHITAMPGHRPGPLHVGTDSLGKIAAKDLPPTLFHEPKERPAADADLQHPARLGARVLYGAEGPTVPEWSNHLGQAEATGSYPSPNHSSCTTSFVFAGRLYD